MTPGHPYRLADTGRRMPRRSLALATSSSPSASAPLRVLGRWYGPPGRPPGWPSATPGWSCPRATSPTSSGVCRSIGATHSPPRPRSAGWAGGVGGLSGGTVAVLRPLPGRAAGHRPGGVRPAKHAGAVWASNRELRLLTVGEPELGRVILGRIPGAFGKLLAAADCHSVLVFGPTGSYKTPPRATPAAREWTGPLTATSARPALLRATLAHRARRGQVLVIDPLGASGVK